MRLRMLRRPTGSVLGFAVDHFQPGVIYEVGCQLAGVFLSEGWAELVDDAAAKRLVLPATPTPPLVLVVDDDADVRTLTTHLLSSRGCSVASAQHGQEALDRLCELSPDLVVLDLNMPVMDGWQFRAAQQRLHEHLASVPVLVMTGADDAKRQAARLDAVGVVQKPCDPDQLLAAIGAALRVALIRRSVRGVRLV